MYKSILKNIVGTTPDTKIIEQLHKRPMPEKEYNDLPHFTDDKPGQTCQADLLHLPEDRGYKYLLVVVDDASRICDGEPLKDRQPSNVIDGFKKIWKRNILKKPHNIELDKGTEFFGKTKQYLTNLGIGIRYAETNRHRQQGLVEAKNNIIGKVIFSIQNTKELETGKQNKEWVKYIKDIIHQINQMAEAGQEKERKKHPLTNFPIWTDNNKNLLKENQAVRVLLNHPIEVHNNKRLGGKFRAGDIRWTKEVYLIKDILLRPDQPPMYTLNDGKSVQYTKQQLQPVSQHYYV
jgi:hypothetical protein